MILDADTAAAGPTLDELFRRAGVRAPQKLALCDPPNRDRVTDGAPRALTYAQADRAISALAARLRGLGLQADAVIGIQLANTVEGVIALLGVLRAGMIAAPLPLLWRQQEIVSALRGVGAKAIIACTRAGSAQPAKTAMLAATELFPIRHICAFGDDLPDGVVPLDPVFEWAADPVHMAVRPGPAAAHVAVVTFEVAAAGPVAMPRSATQLLAGGLAVSREIALADGANVLTTVPPSSFAGLSLAVIPWLLCGGTLALHHGGEPASLAAQAEAFPAATLVLPSPVIEPLAQTGCLLNANTIVALWRAPERLLGSGAWYRDAGLVDAVAFGEFALMALRRSADGKPKPLPFGSFGELEAARTRTGTLALRGSMVPSRAFPSGELLAPDGFVDTGYPCVVRNDTIAVTGQPAGIVHIGGYRFAQHALDKLIADAEPTAAMLPVPDGLLGHRIAGRSVDPATLHATLQARGINALIGGAFRGRSA